MELMDSHAFLADCRVRAWRRISARSGVHSEGLAQAARIAKRMGIVGSHMCKKLVELDTAFQYSKHASNTSTDRFLTKLDSELSRGVVVTDACGSSSGGAEAETQEPFDQSSCSSLVGAAQLEWYGIATSNSSCQTDVALEPGCVAYYGFWSTPQGRHPDWFQRADDAGAVGGGDLDTGDELDLDDVILIVACSVGPRPSQSDFVADDEKEGPVKETARLPGCSLCVVRRPRDLQVDAILATSPL